MTKKRVSYQNLLKQAIAEFDTSKTVDVKGPMLDPILKWDGDGELPVYKDAASILERYYFDQESDKGVEVMDEMEYNEDGTEKKTASEKNAEGTGTQQAGTSDKDIPGEKKEIEKDLAKEDVSVQEKEMNDKDVPKAKEYTDESEKAVTEEAVKEQDGEMEDKEEDKEEEMEESKDLSEDLENQVIEKLIAEMEEEEEEEEEDKEEMAEMDMTYTGEGPKVEAPKEKEASGPEEDAQGAGTQQAGTGDAEGEIPDRKDRADQMVKPKNYTEQDEMKDDEMEDKEEEELDVDKEVKEQAPGAGHIPPPSMQKKMKGEDQGNDDLYEEAFKIFKEQIEEDQED
ncbi:MAG: hypothetical protein ACFFG0_00230 [Candidatus Thorarchaeota archaeon]